MTRPAPVAPARPAGVGQRRWQAAGVPDHPTTPLPDHPATVRPAPGARGGLVVVEARYDSELAHELVRELQAEYVERYGGEDSTPVDPEQFVPPHGSFLVATVGGRSVGSVALRAHRPLDDDPAEVAGPPEAGPVVELKRLYVRADHRRRGYARLILRSAEDRARALGYARLVLETGTEQPEAMALYRVEGYQPVPGYGHYRDAPRSRCFAKALVVG